LFTLVNKFEYPEKGKGAESMTSPVIEARNIVKSFGGVRAVDDVSVSVMPGEIHAVIGADANPCRR
jgi:ABC-type uncharacterized transport system ATPase subunit